MSRSVVTALSALALIASGFYNSAALAGGKDALAQANQDQFAVVMQNAANVQQSQAQDLQNALLPKPDPPPPSPPSEEGPPR